MKMGMGMPIPYLSNLPGVSRPGGGGTPVPPGPTPLAQIDNLNSMEFDGVNDFIKVREFSNSSSAEGVIIGNITISLWFKIGIGTNYSHSNMQFSFNARLSS